MQKIGVAWRFRRALRLHTIARRRGRTADSQCGFDAGRLALLVALVDALVSERVIHVDCGRFGVVVGLALARPTLLVDCSALALGNSSKRARVAQRSLVEVVVAEIVAKLLVAKLRRRVAASSSAQRPRENGREEAAALVCRRRRRRRRAFGGVEGGRVDCDRVVAVISHVRRRWPISHRRQFFDYSRLKVRLRTRCDNNRRRQQRWQLERRFVGRRDCRRIVGGAQNFGARSVGIGDRRGAGDLGAIELVDRRQAQRLGWQLREVASEDSIERRAERRLLIGERDAAAAIGAQRVERKRRIVGGRRALRRMLVAGERSKGVTIVGGERVARLSARLVRRAAFEQRVV